MSATEEAYLETRSVYGCDSPATVDSLVSCLRELRSAGRAHHALEMLDDFERETTIDFESSLSAKVQLEFQRGLTLSALGQHREARSSYESLLERTDQALGPDSERSIQVAINLANTLRRMTEYKVELPLRERILEAEQSREGLDGIGALRSLYDLAQNLDNLGEYGRALELNEVVLPGYERHGLDLKTLAVLRWRMAYELMRLRRPAEAADMYDRVLAYTSGLDPEDEFRRDVEKQRRSYKIARRLGGD